MVQYLHFRILKWPLKWGRGRKTGTVAAQHPTRQSRRREALVNCPSNANVRPSRAAPLDAWARKTVVRGILQFGRVLCGDAQVWQGRDNQAQVTRFFSSNINSCWVNMGEFMKIHCSKRCCLGIFRVSEASKNWCETPNIKRLALLEKTFVQGPHQLPTHRALRSSMCRGAVVYILKGMGKGEFRVSTTWTP